MTTHALKTWPAEFAALASGHKTFEFRADDRTPPFAVDDRLELLEFDPCPTCRGSGVVGPAVCCAPPHGRLTGRVLQAAVSYVLRGAFGVPPGCAVLALKGVRPKVDQWEEDRKLVARLADIDDGLDAWEVSFIENISRWVKDKPLTSHQRERALQIDEEH